MLVCFHDKMNFWKDEFFGSKSTSKNRKIADSVKLSLLFSFI